MYPGAFARILRAAVRSRLAGVVPVVAAVAGAAVGSPFVHAMQAPQAAAADATVVADLANAATYLAGYEKSFAAVVAEETYTQTTTGRTSRRQLRSDVMEMNLDGAAWTQFRDVYEVDGKKVRDHDSRLENLFAKPTSNSLAEAARIATESARYNLGVARTINVPMMALTFLMKPFQFRSTFDAAGHDVIDGRPVDVLAFREVVSPTLVRAKVIHDAPSSGRFWIDPATGDVLRTELRCVVPQKDDNIVGTTTVSYERASALKLLAPATMDEQWVHGKNVDRGHATYTNFRVFTVDTSAVRRGGGGGR